MRERNQKRGYVRLKLSSWLTQIIPFCQLSTLYHVNESLKVQLYGCLRQYGRTLSFIHCLLSHFENTQLENTTPGETITENNCFNFNQNDYFLFKWTKNECPII